MRYVPRPAIPTAGSAARGKPSRIGTRFKALLAEGLALTGMLVAGNALAQVAGEGAETRSAARQLAEQAADYMAQAKWQEAHELFARAYSLIPAPTIALMDGIALEKLGRWVEATECYELARHAELDAAAPQAFRDAVKEAGKKLGELRPRVPQLLLMIDGVPLDAPDLSVELDGKVVPTALLNITRPIDPGKHHVVVRYAKRLEFDRWLPIGETQVVQQNIEVQRVAKSPLLPVKTMYPWLNPGSTQETAGWISLALGGTGIITGLVSGGLMLTHKAALDEYTGCPDNCPRSSQDDLDAFHTTKTISLVGYTVGLVGVGMGGVLLYTAPRKKVAVSAALGPALLTQTLQLRGSF